MQNNTKNKPKLLLHICCVGCGVYVSQVLQDNFNLDLFFYNPNIYSLDEYNKRLKESEKIAKLYNINLIEGEYDHKKWQSKIRGHEQDPEKGERCLICYKDRLEKTAQIAQKNNYDFFSTTLTTSPHKLAKEISKIGNTLSNQYNIKYLDKDFKKNDGFKKASKISQELNLYRQNYCGCEFSLRKQ